MREEAPTNLKDIQKYLDANKNLKFCIPDKKDKIEENHNNYMEYEDNKELRKKIRRLSKYIKWKSDILNRDNNRCQICQRNCLLDVHHIKPFKEIIEDNYIFRIEDALYCVELWDINNGITLCKYCHNEYCHYKGVNYL